MTPASEPRRLAIGMQVGPYEILAKLGQGGMGEVYKARDTRLDRSVAIKTLSSAVTDDSTFHERFDREARAISQLNHPHICALYDLGREGGMPYLVLEYLEGETLEARLARGALPVDRALTIAIQICAALDAAHGHGIVHRDLKPANVMLTKDGVKLLDFGLAKPAVAVVSGSIAATVTRSTPMTTPGTILGTLHYMSPEQVEGREADARSDIFAVGTLLHEMIAGQRPFDGKSPASVIAAILERDPPRLSSVTPLSPPELDQIVATCLAKDPDERWRSAGDLMRILKWLPEPPPASTPVAQAVSGWRKWALLALGLVAVAVAAAAGRMGLATTAMPVPIQHFAIPAPDGHVIPTSLGPQVAISADGATVAFFGIPRIAASFAGPRAAAGQLFVKRMTEPEPTPLAGAEGGMSPFFSPDGEWIGFVQDGQLHKVSRRGGAVVRLAAAGGFSGASWGTDGTIIFAPEHGGAVWSVPADGGEAKQLTFLDRAKGERGHHQPAFLPGSKAFLFTVEMAGHSHDDAQVAVQEIGTREHRSLITGGMAARYVAPGFLVYGRAGQLMAVEFDLNRQVVSGSPRSVLAGVRTNPHNGAGDFDIAANGALAYVPGGSAEFRSRLQWVDRGGNAAPLPLPEADYRNPRLSKSETMVAVTVGGADDDVWLIDLTRNVRQRATFGQENLAPLWFPSGDRLVMNTDPDGAPQLYSMPLAGGSRERLVEGRFPIATSFSPDGSVLLYDDDPGTTGLDIFAMTLPDRQQRPLIQTPFEESSGVFSPDGRWIAYLSNETGRVEVHLIDYPGLTRKIPVSRNGGTEPVWAKNGQELFYLEGDSLVAVPIIKGTTLSVGQPRVLFRGMFFRGAFAMPSYDVSSDGKRFLTVAGDPLAHTATRINYVLGWTSQLKK